MQDSCNVIVTKMARGVMRFTAEVIKSPCSWYISGFDTVMNSEQTFKYNYAFIFSYAWIWGSFYETSTFPNALMDTFAKFGTFCSLLYQVTKLLRQQLPLGSSIKYLLKDLSHFLSVPFLFWKSSEMPNIKRFSWEKEKRLTSWQIA